MLHNHFQSNDSRDQLQFKEHWQWTLQTMYFKIGLSCNHTICDYSTLILLYYDIFKIQLDMNYILKYKQT